jgi:hypothetical protein
MFIKQSVFEKLIKKAYKYDALRIYKSEDDDLIIDTPNWMLGIRKDFITKEVKGALVKLVGDLPERTESILYGKGGNMQYEISGMIDTSILNNDYTKDSEYSPYIVSNVTIEKTYRVIQSESDISIIRMFEQEYLNLIERSLVDIKGGETNVEGPISDDEGSSLRWYTNVCTLEVKRSIAEDYTNELIETLKTIKLERYEE